MSYNLDASKEKHPNSKAFHYKVITATNFFYLYFLQLTHMKF